MISKLISDVTDWLVNDPEKAATAIVMVSILTVLNSVVAWCSAITNKAAIKSVTKQLRERGINVWEWKL